jgi:hypothetical protein
MVRSPGFRAVDALAAEWRIDVDDHVDTGGIEDACTLIVVNLWVDVVDADRVDTEALEKRSVAQAYFAIRERILAVLGFVSALTSWLTGTGSAQHSYRRACLRRLTNRHQ